MSLIKCSECGKEISDKAKTCPNCGAPVVQQNTLTQNDVIPPPIIKNNKPEKKKGSCLKSIGIFFGAIILLGVIGNIIGGSKNNNSEKETTESTIETEESVTEIKESDVKTEEVIGESEESIEIPEISEEDFKASCQEFNYKTIARNPDDYVGQNFVVDVKILQVVNGKWYSDYDVYYKAYTNDEYNMWMGDFLYIIDKQDKESESHVNVLEDDIIRVYGTFSGMSESKNALTGTTSNDVSIDMKYCELINE